MEKKKLNLYNGVEIPYLGLGAEIIRFGEENHKAFENEYEFYCYALQSGVCSLFDTSAAYSRNDEALGNAIFDSGKRNDVQIMTKISNVQQRTGEIRKAFEGHLKYLKTDYVDIYLIHWPLTGRFIQTYNEMEKLYEEGLVKAIGVCNCNIHHLKELEYAANIKPMINQFEITPVFTQDALVNYCKAYDIMPVAYSAVGRMHDVLIKGEPIRKLSIKYNKTPAQIIMKWNEQLGRCALMRTRNKSHFEEVFMNNSEFFLTEKDICWINSMNDNIRLRYNSDMTDFEPL